MAEHATQVAPLEWIPRSPPASGGDALIHLARCNPSTLIQEQRGHSLAQLCQLLRELFLRLVFNLHHVGPLAGRFHGISFQFTRDSVDGKRVHFGVRFVKLIENREELPGGHVFPLRTG